MSTLTYAHIELDKNGVPIISGTTTKVVEVAVDELAHHWDAEEMQRQHPHLTLGQIHSALAYYHDHQEEMDRDIEERMRHTEEIRAQLGDSYVRAKLRTMGRLP